MQVAHLQRTDAEDGLPFVAYRQFHPGGIADPYVAEVDQSTVDKDARDLAAVDDPGGCCRIGSVGDAGDDRVSGREAGHIGEGTVGRDLQRIADGPRETQRVALFVAGGNRKRQLDSSDGAG